MQEVKWKVSHNGGTWRALHLGTQCKSWPEVFMLYLFICVCVCSVSVLQSILSTEACKSGMPTVSQLIQTPWVHLLQPRSCCFKWAHTHIQSVSQSVRDTFFLHAVLCLWSYIQNNILNRLKMPVFLSSVVLHPHFLNCHSFNITSIDKWSQWFSVLLKLKVNKNVSVIHLY